MPSLSDFPELSLEGMNIDSVERSFSVLKANYGDGYGDGTLVGDSGGTQRWVLSAGVLPDSEELGSLIEGLPRMKYYWNFFQARMAEGDGLFVITFRGQSYLASFVDTKISAEVFTSDLFAGGVEVRQRRLAGLTTDPTGGFVFDSSYADGLMDLYVAGARPDGTWLEESPDALLEEMTASDMSLMDSPRGL
jgi:hypothetical protein